MAKGHAHRIDPEPVGLFGIARAQVSGKARFDAETGQQAQARSQLPFAVRAFLYRIGRHGLAARRIPGRYQLGVAEDTGLVGGFGLVDERV
jgi:hypothetical protein